MSASFTVLLSKLRDDACKVRIQKALESYSDISNEDELRSIVNGLTRAEISSFLQKAPLSLHLCDASALAGLLVASPGNYISLSHLISPTRLLLLPFLLLFVVFL
jgi:hypothetical protein